MRAALLRIDRDARILAVVDDCACDDVSVLQLVNGGDPLDDPWDLMGHVVRIERLLQLFIDPEIDGQVLGVVDLVDGDQLGAHGGEGGP